MLLQRRHYTIKQNFPTNISSKPPPPYLPAPLLEPPVEPEVLPGCEIRVEDAVLGAQSKPLLHLRPAVPHRHAKDLDLARGGLLKASQQLARESGGKNLIIVYNKNILCSMACGGN